MDHLERYYDARASDLQENDFLKQVGHTEGGNAIGPEQYHLMVQQLRDLLKPNSDDRLLDLCCGNGVITADLAVGVKMAVGVELSGRLVTLARKYHGGAHTRYFKQDVFKLSEVESIEGERFSKILMHGALQHFKPADFDTLLRTILSYAAQDCVIVFGFVPLNGKQRYFYNTPKRKIQAFVYRVLKRDVFGSWWDKSLITNTCNKLGLECEISDIDASLNASAYRCNIKITRHSKINA